MRPHSPAPASGCTGHQTFSAEQILTDKRGGRGQGAASRDQAQKKMPEWCISPASQLCPIPLLGLVPRTGRKGQATGQRRDRCWGAGREFFLSPGWSRITDEGGMQEPGPRLENWDRPRSRKPPHASWHGKASVVPLQRPNGPSLLSLP